MRLLLASGLVLAAVVTYAQQTTDPELARQKEMADRRVAEMAQAARMPPRACLHGSDEAPDQRTRRQAAINLARQINTAEARGSVPSGTYLPFSSLTNVGAIPDGFGVTLTTDGVSYAFAIKDTLDACHFALFSDQTGLIYNATPLQ